MQLEPKVYSVSILKQAYPVSFNEVIGDYVLSRLLRARSFTCEFIRKFDRARPWSTINAERFDSKTTTVLVLKAEPPHDVIDFLSTTAVDLLDTIIDSCTTLGSNNSYIPGNLIIVFTSNHARLLDRDSERARGISPEQALTYSYPRRFFVK